MIVTLNGRPFDMTLERERTVGELLAGMERWLEQSRFSVSGFKIDGRLVPVEEVEEACSMNLDEIEEIDVIASSWRDLFVQALRDCARRVEEAAAERSAARAEGRRPDTAAVAEKFEKSAASAFLSGNARDVYEGAQSALRGDSMDPDLALATIRAMIGERTEELEEPIRELAEARGTMQELAERLEAIPLELQTGKDAAAALSLQKLAALISKLMRLIPVLADAGIDFDSRKIGEYGFRDFFDELNTALKELTAGYENGDAILVGDLAEYELAPRLRTLAESFAGLSEK